VLHNKSILVARVAEERHGLGDEHPLCDSVQMFMIVLFFVVWSIDSLSRVVIGYSTVLFGLAFLPARLVLLAVFIGFGYYLVAESHKLVFRKVDGQPEFVGSGVYAMVRHPMYLGILLFCLAFLFVSTSVVSIGIWVVFFAAYDRMVTYEEKSLVETLGEEYAAYQKRVPKWFPGIHRLRRKAAWQKPDVLER
jgi:protein-S-isoprenylcysteine O-methyltransferase Ste14